MSFDKIFDFVVNSVRKEEQRKHEEQTKLGLAIRPFCLTNFSIIVKAGDLIGPARTKAINHREREQHYVKALEIAEAELREKGISIEVFDNNTGTYLNFNNTIASGCITGGPQAQQFQPRVDQKLMDAVKNAKSKMIEHRQKAEEFEKYVRAFSLNRDAYLTLSVEDVTYFGLGS